MACSLHPQWPHSAEDCPFCANRGPIILAGNLFKLEEKHLKCMRCGKQVSSGYFPIENEIDKNDIVIRAWIECPECIEKSRENERRK